MFPCYYRYNRDMETNDTNCNTCGRPWGQLPQPCNYIDSCLSEYSCVAPACIRKDKPNCLAKAVIPAVTVETIDGITSLANCFVHVTSINTTFYVDDKHRPMVTWAGPVEAAEYDIEHNPLGLRSQSCYTEINGVWEEVFFDRTGIGHMIGQEV